MKTLIAVILTLMIAVPGFAKKKEAPVYDQTGIVFRTGIVVNHYDSTASLSVNGETYFAGCDISDTNIRCSDTQATGGNIMLKLDDSLAVGLPASATDFSHQTSMVRINPLEQLLHANGDRPVVFKYRWIRLNEFGSYENYICVPYTREEKHGKPVISEACYLQ